MGASSPAYLLAAYVGFGIPANHLIAALVMSAPVALVISKIMFPETEESPTRGEVKIQVEKTTANGVDAIASGALDGLQLALNIAAMIIRFSRHSRCLQCPTRIRRWPLWLPRPIA